MEKKQPKTAEQRIKEQLEKIKKMAGITDEK